MASKLIGSIVSTDTSTNLKTVFHVHKDGGSVTFTKPDSEGWSHLCHPSVKNTPEGWAREANTLYGGFADSEFFPI